MNFCKYRLPDMPEAKEQFGFEELNGVLYAVCGVTTGAIHSQTLYAYNVNSGIWTRKTDAPIPLQSPVFRAAGGKLYLIGGYNSYIPLKYNTCYEYDPAYDSWAQKANMPTAREDAMSAVVDDKIYVFGGVTNPAHTMTRAVEWYDPSIDMWTVEDDIPENKALGDQGVTYNGKIYLISGTADMATYSYNLRANTRVMEYDPVTQSWTYRTEAPWAKCYGEVEEIGGKLYFIGGCHVKPAEYTPVDEVYDIASDSWESDSSMAYQARAIGLAKYNGCLYVAGGFNGVFLSKFYRLTVYGT